MQPQGVVTEDFSWGPAHPTQDEEAAGIPSIKQSSTSTTILSDDDKFADRIFKYIESKGHACDMHTIGAKVPKREVYSTPRGSVRFWAFFSKPRVCGLP